MALRRVSRGVALLGAFAALASHWGCASGGDVDIATLASSSDQVIWEAAQKAMEKKQWETARKYLKRIIEGFPQGQTNPPARIAYADAYFNEGGEANYILAISAYRDFLTLFPSHPRSDYAQFQIGEAYFRQRNGPDRDQTSTIRALDEFQHLLEVYPSSAQEEVARERIKACRQSLARSEYMVGYFYQRTRHAYRSAALRFQSLLKDYPDYDQIDEVLLHLGQVQWAAGRTAEALPTLQRLLETYPESQFVGEAQELIREINERAPQVAAPPTETAPSEAETPPAPPPPSQALGEPGEPTP
jgi:outer membrane protein assembly factor BamD